MGSVNAPGVIRAKSVVTPDGILDSAQVRVERGRIRAVESLSPDVDLASEADGILIPGIIDIQTNGAFGVDFADCETEQLEEVSRRLAARGCTAFLPTLISDQPDRLSLRLQRLSRSLAEGRFAAQPLGIHLEGPFLNPEKAGAHRREALTAPSIRLFDRFQAAAVEQIRLLTLAPELPGAGRLIAHCRSRCVLSAGHSQATFDEMSDAIDAGVRAATHTFNAMPGLQHRDPGLLAAILTRNEVFATVIPDGLHLHPAVVEMVVRCKLPGRSVMVTDSISAAGMPDGDYPLGEQVVRLERGVCRNEAGTLAGSSLLPDQGLRNLWKWLGRGRASLPLNQVMKMLSAAPAELLGLEDRGRIASGQVADLVLLNEDFKVLKTWVKGELLWNAESR